GGKLKRSATNEPSILSFFSLVFAWMTKNLLWTDFQSRFFYKLNGREFPCRFQFVEKALLFHKLNPYLKWKRGLSPLFPLTA
ncbi:MAG TPA: hypothetical protein H9698_01560, partial [Candidatus Ruthenibacterium merdavium]|nr:hypothetical protein [Candidatus Ruthenibacterium merdavium]